MGQWTTSWTNGSAAVLLTACLVPVIPTAALAAETWNAVSDFSLVSNPDGPWSYLVNGAPMSVLFPSSVTGLVGWWNDQNNPDSAIILKNETDANITISNTVVITPGLLTMDPESQTATVSFTAPSEGSYRIKGEFTGQDTTGNPHQVSITRDKAVLWKNNISTYLQSDPFSFTTTLRAGETLDFNVMTGSGDCSYCYLATGLTAEIQHLSKSVD